MDGFSKIRSVIPLDAIRSAAERIRGKVHRTPLLSSSQLGERARPPVRLSLKCENFQKSGSFKARGALNKILSLWRRGARAGPRHRLGR